VHEGFTNYSEGLYTECQQGKEAGARYLVGLRQNVQNDQPVTGPYGVNREGSGDMYYKASNMLHTMRQVIGDDERWRGILRGLNQTFRHQTVTGRMVQEYINRESGINFDKVFEQYLTTTQIPVLEYRISDGTLAYRWANAVPGFDLPVKVALSDSGYETIRPTASWQTVRLRLSNPASFKVDENYYVEPRNVGTAGR
jgi:aminopeptidase N